MKKVNDCSYQLITIQFGVAILGNLSGREGDLSDIYEAVKQISMEISDASESSALLKQKKADDVQLLASTEETILLPHNGTKKRANENTAVKIRNLDGSITVDAEREAKKNAAKPQSLEHRLVQLLEQEIIAVKHSPEAVVDSIRNKMLSYVEQVSMSTQQFLDSAFKVTKKPPPDYILPEFEAFGGVPTFIQFFCDKDNVHFAAAKFITVCETMGIAVREARMLHIYMCSIKELACLSYPDQSSSSAAASDLSTAAPPTPLVPNVGSTSSATSNDTTVTSGSTTVDAIDLNTVLYVPLPHLHNIGDDEEYNLDEEEIDREYYTNN